MDVSMWVLIGMLTTAMALVFWRGGWRMLLSGFREGALTFKSIWVRLVLGFSLGGLIQVVIPSPVIAEWLGPASGVKGILIGSYAGIIITGGPYVTLPVVASIFAAGAGAGPVIAVLTSMNLLSLPGLLTWAIPFMGVRLALSRYIVCLVIPPIVGLAGSAIYEFLAIG
jgi:uncharacterized membrane protein YraQ (UPF0718 family)